MSGVPLYVDFFRALRAAVPPGRRSISTSGVAVMCLISTSSGGTSTTSGLAKALGGSYTGAWNQCERLERAGLLRRTSRAWALTPAGQRAIDVLAGAALPDDVAD